MWRHLVSADDALARDAFADAGAVQPAVVAEAPQPDEAERDQLSDALIEQHLEEELRRQDALRSASGAAMQAAAVDEGPALVAATAAMQAAGEAPVASSVANSEQLPTAVSPLELGPSTAMQPVPSLQDMLVIDLDALSSDGDGDDDDDDDDDGDGDVDFVARKEGVVHHRADLESRVHRSVSAPLYVGGDPRTLGPSHALNALQRLQALIDEKEKVGLAWIARVVGRL